jgi:hypothetical protein
MRNSEQRTANSKHERDVDRGKGPLRSCCENTAVSKWSGWILHLLCIKIGLNHGARVRARVLAKGKILQSGNR